MVCSATASDVGHEPVASIANLGNQHTDHLSRVHVAYHVAPSWTELHDIRQFGA